MLEIPAWFHLRLPSLERAGALEKTAVPQVQTADDCWQITLYLLLPRLEEVPVRRARGWGERDQVLECLSMQDQG
jgi:hypothetical protein